MKMGIPIAQMKGILHCNSRPRRTRRIKEEYWKVTRQGNGQAYLGIAFALKRSASFALKGEKGLNESQPYLMHSRV